MAAVGLQSHVDRSSAVRTMIGPTGRTTKLLLLLLLRGYLSTSLSQLRTSLHYEDPQELSSWSSQNLSSVPEVDIRLMHLDLSRNFIRRINSQGLYLPSLKTLDLSNNQLQTISEGAFRYVTKLQELNVARNLLSHNVDGNSQALGTLNQLRRLDLSMNNLDDGAAELYLRNKPVLEYLDLTGNVLMQLVPNQFAESRNLRSINIENNLIAVIEKGTFEPLKKLEMLNLAKNNLAYICDFKLHQIKLLNLSSNSIEFFFTSKDGQMYNLEILDLSYNKLLYFPMVPTTNRLRALHLQSNMLGLLGADNVLSEASSLYRELTADDENDAVEYNIYSNWRLMPLISIDLSSNHFRSFPVEALSQLTSLSTLILSNNCLQAISYNMTNDGGGHPPSLTFPSLRFFNLQNNGLWQLSSFFLESLPSIETLNLRQNAVRPCDPTDQLETSEIGRGNSSTSCVSFRNIKTLKHLDLQDNGIKTLHQNTFQKTPLVSLNLAINVGMNFDRDALEELQNSLQSLSISGNNMKTSDLSLPCLKGLKRLNMSGNNIDVLPSIISCCPLEELDVRNNSLTSMDASVFNRLSKHLKVVYVSGNPFNCCDATWFTVLSRSHTDMPDLEHAVCFRNGTNDTNATELLRKHSLHCSVKRRPKAPKLNLWQVILFIVFMLTVLITVQISIGFVKKACCNTGSLIV